MGRRLAYSLLGFSVGLIASLVLEAVFGKRVGIASIAVAIGFSSIAVGIAEHRGKVKSIEEINRPLTLFPPGSTPDQDKSK
jgi:hypothetical protein